VVVPTSRERIMVTVTDELDAALKQAEKQWPGLSRSALITRLALRGEVRKISPEAAERRRQALAHWQGLPGYDGSLMAQLHDEWRS
jgi:hypothetical protein